MQAKQSNSPITIALRVQDGEKTNELTGKFVSSDTIWSILRKFEKKNKGLNLTEKYASSATQGAGRLLYEMPAVMVVNKELVSFAELQQSLVGLGVREGKLLVVLRFKSTTIPYEDALEEIAKISPKEEEEDLLVAEEAEGSRSAAVEQKKEDSADVEMVDTPPPVTIEQTEVGSTEAREEPSIAESEMVGDGQSDSKTSIDPNRPAVSIYRPSDSTTPAAAQSKQNS